MSATQWDDGGTRNYVMPPIDITTSGRLTPPPLTEDRIRQIIREELERHLHEPHRRES